LNALAPQLSGEAKEHALQAGLAAALAIQDEWAQVSVLSALAPQLSGEAKERALQAGLAVALAIKGEWFRTSALSALAPQLSKETKERALQAGLAAALAIQDERSRASVLNVLAPQLSGELLQAGLAAALTIKDEWFRTCALTKFVFFAPNKEALLKQFQHAVANAFLFRLKDKSRDSLLSFCANSTLLSPPTFSAEILEDITKLIIEICSEWEWL
jgi:hypothetical protein